MTKQNTWLTPFEVASSLSIAPRRVAQLMRTGILPFELTAADPLIHARNLKNIRELFPDLLKHFQVENEVEKMAETDEFHLVPEVYLRPSTVHILACVKRRSPNFPSR